MKSRKGKICITYLRKFFFTFDFNVKWRNKRIHCAVSRCAKYEHGGI